ncbi:M1 family aminopeptidase [Actinomycetospora cinnamomea]|uniref:Peptidase M1-like protein n=1 Tax=Actinomycetospora cinnamomea TaxID=663609 RepID=A0A2U1FM17_9PSEU|nr:M1 family aminopeptidase [Actinomycetospora cinnamomea]PVZ13152.1 peptidase M1-like protein [Actinomycetospora cinnamomea]
MPSRSLLAVLVATLLALVGCGAPRAEAAPWPQRPAVDLAFDVAPDLRSATGRETLTFTPDLPICELVFRAWPNAPSPAREGNALTVTDAVVQGRPTVPVIRPAGAPSGAPGTLIELPLPTCVAAGETVRAELGFTLTLGVDADERLGVSPAAGTAWWGSGFPLLAWVRGQGWVRDDAVRIPGETAVSEEFRLDALRVTAPEGAAVSGAGRADPPAPGPRPGTTTHVFRADAVRDVTVAVGNYRVLEREVAGTRLHLFTPAAGTRADPERWAAEIDRALGRLQDLLGPMPYRDLWVAIAPSQSSGLEYPGALQFGDTAPGDLAQLVTHELGHQWFYALVGNNQARDPWIDEAFTTWAQAVATDTTGRYQLDDVPDGVRGDLGDPMREWADRGFGAYNVGVYTQGAAVLLAARERAGAERFDEAVRDYLATHAHGVAAPADVSRAFADLPEVTDALTRAGALPPPG